LDSSGICSGIAEELAAEKTAGAGEFILQFGIVPAIDKIAITVYRRSGIRAHGKEDHVAETKGDYRVGYRKPPAGKRFQKGKSGNPTGRPRKKDLPELLAAALNEPVFVTTEGERRRITKREAIVTQLVNKSTRADLRATKMLIDMQKEVEQKAGGAAPREPARLSPADREVVEQFIARLRRQIAAEAAEAAAAGDPSP
jgi:Family of unknown function (DUF5681)